MNEFYKILILISTFLCGYIMGSIPFSIILGKYFYHKDPRNYGSKNPGGSNVGRVIGHKAAVLTITLDAIKIIIPFIIVYLLFTKNEQIINFMDNSINNSTIFWYGKGNSLCELAYYLVPLGGFFGHAYSCFLKFKGGKIVSTYVSFLCTTSLVGIPLFAFVFFGLLKRKKHVSLSSICASIFYMFYSWIIFITFALTKSETIVNYFMRFGFGPNVCIYYPIVSTIGTLLLIYRHKSNIKKLIKHEESKVTWIDNIFKSTK